MATGSESGGRGSSFRFDTRQIVVAGIIGGIALFLGFTRLGFIPVPIPLIGNATIMHIPAIIGGVLGLAILFGLLPIAIIPAVLPQAIAEAVLAAAVTVVIVRGVMLFRSGRTTAPETGPDEERRY